MTCEGEVLKNVVEFKYLGSMFTSTTYDTQIRDITRRIALSIGNVTMWVDKTSVQCRQHFNGNKNKNL